MRPIPIPKADEIRYVLQDIKDLTATIAELEAARTLKRIRLSELQSSYSVGDRFRYRGRKRYYQKKVFELIGFHEEGPLMCYVLPDGTLSKRFIIMKDSTDWARVGHNTDRRSGDGPESLL